MSQGTKLKPRLGLKASEAGLLQAHVVIGVEVVDPDHGLAAGEQRLGDVITDEPGGPGHQDWHVLAIPVK